MKNNIAQIENVLRNKKVKTIAMLAPSFVAEFNYPEVIGKLRALGFDKIVELTFGAKMINREYHRILECNEKKEVCERKFYISSVCPGITEVVREKYPQFSECLIKVDSPMIATAKICKKFYPKHRVIFISPCNYKKIEAERSKYVDYVVDYIQLKQLFEKNKGKLKPQKVGGCLGFDRFYNDYTKIYPLSGGLSKTAHLKGVLKKGEEKTIDGIKDVMSFLELSYEKRKDVRFLDVTFCRGGCIGGPCLTNKNIAENKGKVMKYLKVAEKEKMPKGKEGLIKKARGIKFTY